MHAHKETIKKLHPRSVSGLEAVLPAWPAGSEWNKTERFRSKTERPLVPLPVPILIILMILSSISPGLHPLPVSEPRKPIASLRKVSQGFATQRKAPEKIHPQAFPASLRPHSPNRFDLRYLA